MYEKTRRLLQETTGCHTAAVPLLLKRIKARARADAGFTRFPSVRARRRLRLAPVPGGPISGAGRKRPTVRRGGVRTRRSQASSASLRLRRTDPQLSAVPGLGLLLLFIAHGGYAIVSGKIKKPAVSQETTGHEDLPRYHSRCRRLRASGCPSTGPGRAAGGRFCPM